MPRLATRPRALLVNAPASQYERHMGRWSRGIAHKFVAWLGAPPGERWLDVGCGTGALSFAIAERAAPLLLHGVDPDARYIAHASARAPRRCLFHTCDVGALPALLQSAYFDITVSGLALNQFPDPAAGLRNMTRLTRAGGTVAAYVWDFAEGMPLFRVLWDAARGFDPSAHVKDPMSVFPICRPQPLREAFRKCGLRNVQCRALSTAMTFASFEEFWEPMRQGHGRNGSYVASLPVSLRRRLREGVRGRLPIRADGTIRLVAKAWAVKGHVRNLE